MGEKKKHTYQSGQTKFRWYILWSFLIILALAFTVIVTFTLGHLVDINNFIKILNLLKASWLFYVVLSINIVLLCSIFFYWIDREFVNFRSHSALKLKDDGRYKYSRSKEHLKPEEDGFQRRKLAGYYATVIMGLTKPPYTFGVVSEWGSGKTVFMNFMKDELDGKYKNESLTVRVDALKYEKLSDLSLALLIELEEEASKRKVGCRFRFLVRKLISYLDDFSEIGAKTNFLKSANKIISRFINDFNKLVLKIKCKIGYDAKIIFFIDNLDRVNSSRLIPLLDSIHTLFSNENCVFVIAIDIDAVGNAIKTLYGNDCDILPHKYIEKWIDSFIFLPMRLDAWIKDEIKKTIERMKENEAVYLDDAIESFGNFVKDLIVQSKVNNVRNLNPSFPAKREKG